MSLPESKNLTAKVSVITPLYNSATFIEKTLDSLLAQTYTNWESLLVDDGSTDDTASVVAPYLKDARFHYLRQENQGIAGARNAGILAATGEWICLLDHDDRWLPEKLEKQLRYAGAYNCDIVCTDAFNIDGKVWSVYSHHFPDVAEAVQRAATDASIDVFGLLIRRNFIRTCSVMLRRSLFEERGLLDPDAVPADDYEMWLRCMPEAKIGFVGEPLVEYVLHEANYSNDLVRMYEKIIYVLRKHRRRHARDRARARQFDNALASYYSELFSRLSADRRYADILRRLPLLFTRRGRGARSILYKTTIAQLFARARNTIRYRLGFTRV